MSADLVGLSFVVLGLLILAGYFIRLKLKILQKYFIPSSVIAGFLGLILGPEILGSFIGEDSSIISDGLFPEEIIQVWKEIPGLFITVIFATIFLGKEIYPLKKVWKIAGPQMAFGQTIAWGQYVIGTALALFLLVPLFDIDPIVGALIEISFQGGIGSATGLAPTFESLGFSDARDLGVGLATIGMISGLIFGIAIINWGARKGITEEIESPEESDEEELKGFFDTLPSAGKQTTRTVAIETLTIHIAFIAASIFIGFLILKALQLLESLTWSNWSDFVLMEHFPLFPLALVGSVIVQVSLNKFTTYPFINYKLMKRINGFALDIMVASAIASLSLSVIGQHIIPFVILGVAGIAWNIFAFFFIAKRILPDHWFERGICDFGQSMGMTAIGLLLARISDPDNKTPAVEGFAYKQIIFEPIVGGGIFTVASGPLIAQLGLLPLLIGTGILGIGWFLFGYFHFGNN